MRHNRGMSPVVHLHIGAPKTGTTYLQHRLSRNVKDIYSFLDLIRASPDFAVSLLGAVSDRARFIAARDS